MYLYTPIHLHIYTDLDLDRDIYITSKSSGLPSLLGLYLTRPRPLCARLVTMGLTRISSSG